MTTKPVFFIMPFDTDEAKKLLNGDEPWIVSVLVPKDTPAYIMIYLNAAKSIIGMVKVSGCHRRTTHMLLRMIEEETSMTRHEYWVRVKKKDKALAFRVEEPTLFNRPVMLAELLPGRNGVRNGVRYDGDLPEGVLT